MASTQITLASVLAELEQADTRKKIGKAISNWRKLKRDKIAKIDRVKVYIAREQAYLRILEAAEAAK